MEFILLFITIFKIVCYFNIFNKSGERGWKAIVPILDIYTRFKLFYKKKAFIIYIIILLALVFSVFMITLCGMELMTYYDGGDPYDPAWMASIPSQLLNSTTAFFFMFIICSLIIFIFELILNYHMTKSFNRGLGFFFGLVFINVVFLAILAFFNENTYIGNLTEKNQNISY